MKVKVVQKQENGKKCIVCGLKNEFGLKSEFYELENGELLSLCKTGELHQSYPGRVHGGVSSAILDEVIARAIAIDPEILVFDDSFSALDFKTDSILRAELSKNTKDKTVIIVAQRINTILNADQIIVLEDGKIVGKGTHEELIKNNETYRQIALSQLSEEELNIQEGGEKHE